jgi:hypothetical protein
VDGGAFRPVAEDDADWVQEHQTKRAVPFCRRDFINGFEYGMCNALDFLNGSLGE